MAISRASLDLIPTSFVSVSVGTPYDPLPDKLRAISAAGFQAIELSFPDLVSFALSHHKRKIEEDDYENLCSAGVAVRELYAANKLDIMMLQPFTNYEGWPEGSNERTEAFEGAKGWIKVMQAVGTNMLQVCTILSHNTQRSTNARF
jgi:sugar phosphate isomerase/epimerase